MLLYIILLLCLLSMLAGPIIYSYRSEGSSENIPTINHDNTRNPRYFSLSFKKLLSKAMAAYDGRGSLHLSTDEAILFADSLGDISNQEFEHMVIEQNDDLIIGESNVFKKEIYAAHNATIGANNQLRSVACEQELVLHENSNIIRWADAEGTLRAHHHSHMGVSSSSAKMLLLGEQCRFKRLYAPIIRLGLSEDEIVTPTIAEASHSKPIVNPEIRRNLTSVDDEKTEDDKIYPFTIITEKPIVVFKGFKVQGDISSHSNVLIDDDAIVHGNIFAEGNVVLGNNSTVFGNIFTQEDVKVLDGVTIGRLGATKSVVARGNIEFGRDCTVYGYISSERSGNIRPFA